MNRIERHKLGLFDTRWLVWNDNRTSGQNFKRFDDAFIYAKLLDIESILKKKFGVVKQDENTAV